MLKLIASAAISFSLILGAGVAIAANPHNGATGRPDAECEDFVGSTPGNATTARGSAFNPNGVGHNAYENAGAPSQYDVACLEQAQR